MMRLLAFASVVAAVAVASPAVEYESESGRFLGQVDQRGGNVRGSDHDSSDDGPIRLGCNGLMCESSIPGNLEEIESDVKAILKTQPACARALEDLKDEIQELLHPRNSKHGRYLPEMPSGPMPSGPTRGTQPYERNPPQMMPPQMQPPQPQPIAVGEPNPGRTTGGGGIKGELKDVFKAFKRVEDECGEFAVAILEFAKDADCSKGCEGFKSFGLASSEAQLRMGGSSCGEDELEEILEKVVRILKDLIEDTKDIYATARRAYTAIESIEKNFSRKCDVRVAASFGRHLWAAPVAVDFNKQCCGVCTSAAQLATARRALCRQIKDLVDDVLKAIKIIV